METDVPSREKLQEELRKAELAVTALEALDSEDPDMTALLDIKRQKRDAARAQLHAARPLRSQLRAAEEAKDKASKKHAALSEEIHAIKLILEGKEKEMVVAAAEVKANLLLAHNLHSQIMHESLAEPGAAPGWVGQTPPSPPMSTVQLAAALAYSLPPNARESFEQWMFTAPVGPQTPPETSTAPSLEHDDDEEELWDPSKDEDEELLQDATPTDSNVHKRALVPFGAHSGPTRQRRARVDPYPIGSGPGNKEHEDGSAADPGADACAQGSPAAAHVAVA